MGLTTGVDISPGEKSGDVVDDLIAAMRLEARSGDCPCWARRRFPSDAELLTEREGVKGAERRTGASAVDVVASDITVSSSEWRQNVFRVRRKGMVRMMMIQELVCCGVLC